MIPVALAAVWFGAPFFPVLVAVAGAGMGYEWARLARLSFPVATLLVAGIPVAAAIATALGRDSGALAIAGCGALAVALIARRDRVPLLAALGTLWLALPCIAVLWLARGPSGRATILWLLAVVWASDIGAYAFGRLIGGARLAPVLSPNKTWAGAIGGLLCAALAGAATALVAGGALGAVVAVSLVLAVAAEAGDLVESCVKRRFGAKDSGTLIPGHGGVLDRLDSLLAATLMAAVMLLIVGNPLIR